MSALWAFIRINWKPAAILLLALIAWFALRHYGDSRYAAGVRDTQAEDAKALAKRQIENAQKEKADAKRIADAYRAREASEAELATIRARPLPKLVCRTTPNHREPMPETARVPDAQTASSGLFPEQDAGNSGRAFDPGPEAAELAQEAARVVADCRYLHQAVHGFPTR